MAQKVVISTKYGGYGLSAAAIARLLELGAELSETDQLVYLEQASAYEYDRTNPLLIQVVEELGERANGRFADLQVVEIPNWALDYPWEISEYDGLEQVVIVLADGNGTREFPNRRE